MGLRSAQIARLPELSLRLSFLPVEAAALLRLLACNEFVHYVDKGGTPNQSPLSGSCNSLSISIIP